MGSSEQLLLLAQLIGAMKDSAMKMEIAQNKNDVENYERAKQEILKFQKKISQIINKEV